VSILPTYLSSQIEAAETENKVTDIPYEYGIDYSTGQMTGEIVSGLEAVKVWIWNCIHTQRFLYPVFSWDYGADLEQYIGHMVTNEFLTTTCKKEVEEAMLMNPYITDLDDFSVTLNETKLNISFTANTKFGSVEVSENV